MLPDEILSFERAQRSPLFERMIFLLASPESGAETVLDALGCLPDVVAAPVPTNLFVTGIPQLLNVWVAIDDTERQHGLEALVDQQELLWATRCMADRLFEPLRQDGGWIVEYSPDHIAQAEVLAAVYPDARLLQVVRDGRDVAARLASRDRANYRFGEVPDRMSPGWLARAAARGWCADQRSLNCLQDHENLSSARIERVLQEPEAFLRWLAGELSMDVDDEAIAVAVAALGGGTWDLPKPADSRAQVMVQVLGEDLLEQYGYQTEAYPERRRLAARVELGIDGLGGRVRQTRQDLIGRMEAATARLQALSQQEQHR